MLAYRGSQSTDLITKGIVGTRRVEYGFFTISHNGREYSVVFVGVGTLVRRDEM